MRRTYDAEVICLEIPTVEVCAFAVAVEVSKLDPTELVVAAFADHEESRSLGFCGGRKIPRWAIQRCWQFEICVSAVAAKVSGLRPADIETRGTENFLVQEFYDCSRNSKLGPAPVIAWSIDSWGKFWQKGRILKTKRMN